MDKQGLYNLIDAYLDNEINRESADKMKRVKLPIPEEYGGGWATGDTLLDAVRNLIKRIGVKQAPKDVPLFSECYERWIQIKMGENLSPCTMANYKRLANDRIIPFFGNLKINEITSDDVQLYFNSIIKLSKSYSTQSKAILKGVFGRAERNGIIFSNPMRFDYKQSKKEKKKTVLQDDELIDVIRQLDNLSGSDYIYVCFLCFTALRRGEILGLKWVDIDFENHQIMIHNNVVYPDGTNDPVLKEPKDGSFGVIHLHSELLKRIEPYRLTTGYVIRGSQSSSEKPISRSSFTKMWNRINKSVDLKGATSHSFRASYATMMNAHCKHIDPKALQGALRHKTPDLAMKVYTKENRSKTRKAEKEYDLWLTNELAQRTSPLIEGGVFNDSSDCSF